MGGKEGSEETCREDGSVVDGGVWEVEEGEDGVEALVLFFLLRNPSIPDLFFLVKKCVSTVIVVDGVISAIFREW